MAVFLAPLINDQQEDANGAPLSGGTIEVYVGGTSTPSTTYSDRLGTVPNTWPIVLNTLGVNGQGAVWVTGGVPYKFIIKNSVGVVQRTIDYVPGINDSTVGMDQWINIGVTPSYVSATSFTLPGDQTPLVQVGRRLRTQNTGGLIYSTIIGATYAPNTTTVTVRNESGVLDTGLSQVWFGLISAGSDTSLPGGIPIFGQCRLVKSGANIVLQPYNGNRLTINNSICLIPTAGVSLAPTGLVPSTLYYIYAFMNGGAMALGASATGHATDANTGIEIMSGDPTRVLVGMAYVITGPAFIDTATRRMVASWFNRRRVELFFASGVDFPSSSAAAVNINTFQSLEFLSWVGETVATSLNIPVKHSGANGLVQSSLTLDAFNTFNMGIPNSWQAYANNANGSASWSRVIAPAEGYHQVNPSGATSAAQATWLSGGFIEAVTNI